MSCGGKDESYLVAAIARRKLKMNNTIFCLRIPEIGVLLHPKHPDTTMFTGDHATISLTNMLDNISMAIDTVLNDNNFTK